MIPKTLLLSDQSSMPIRVFDRVESLKSISNPTIWKIMKELIEPSCPIDIAKRLGMHEQKVYYYINKLKKDRLIKEVDTEQRHGAIARFYQIKDHAFGIKLKASEKKINPPNLKDYKLLEPFIKDGNINSKIIVGSPDPHGPWKLRASDSCCAIDFALFLGSYISGDVGQNYRLDTEIREKDLKGNLILIGGPTVNMVTKDVIKRSPIFIDVEKDREIISTLSGETYTDEECGIISIIDNPYEKESKILILAGNRFQGTKASVIAFIKRIEDIMKGNRFKRSFLSRVVKGYDLDGDGLIDDVEILE